MIPGWGSRTIEFFEIGHAPEGRCTYGKQDQGSGIGNGMDWN